MEGTLGALGTNYLLKKSKCAFGKKKIEYLGHVISKEKVATDPAKIQNMLQWPKPNSLKSLRVFWGSQVTIGGSLKIMEKLVNHSLSC